MSHLSDSLGFLPGSSFTPRLGPKNSGEWTRCSSTSPVMVAPKHVRRSEEIKRLTKQLEELRAARDKMKQQDGPEPAARREAPPQQVQPAKETAPCAEEPSPTSEVSLQFGKHAEGSRFLSISNIGAEEYLPRIVPVAGRVPGLSTAELMAVPALLHSKTPQQGNVFTTKVTPEYTGELVVLPDPEVVSKCGDPVVLKVDPNELSASQLPITDNEDVLIVLDRSAASDEFENTKFYAWDVGGKVRVGWAKTKPSPAEAKCLGKIVVGTLEIKKELRKKKSCWEEENETYG